MSESAYCAFLNWKTIFVLWGFQIRDMEQMLYCFYRFFKVFFSAIQKLL